MGIFITGSLANTFNSNFVPLLKKGEDDFNRWSTLPLSLAGRVNLIKMTILTKFLYLFQHILLFLNTFFAKIDKSISHFLWGNKSVCMWNNILQLPTDFLHYYRAVNIQKLLYLSDEGTANQPAWVQVESSSSQTSLRSLLCS